jgi:hypothetical protein
MAPLLALPEVVESEDVSDSRVEKRDHLLQLDARAIDDPVALGGQRRARLCSLFDEQVKALEGLTEAVSHVLDERDTPEEVVAGAGAPGRRRPVRCTVQELESALRRALQLKLFVHG